MPVHPPSAVDRTFRVGILGGVPPALGGHGMELQIERTAAGLEALGHRIIRVAGAPQGTTWDVLHVFGSEGDNQHVLNHWTRARTPLVVSPVVVTSPGRLELELLVAARWPAPVTHAALRRRMLRGADRLVAGTAYEARVLRRLVGRRAPVTVVPNGADPVAPSPGGAQPAGYALLLGTVSARKNQERVVRALAGTAPVVVAGGYAGDTQGLRRWEKVVAETGTRWLGHVNERAQVARLVADAATLVHLATAEVQSLAVLEAVSAGTPVVLSNIPSHRELAATYPDWVHLVDDTAALAPLVTRLRAAARPAGAPVVPTWRDIAWRLTAVYASVVPAPL